MESPAASAYLHLSSTPLENDQWLAKRATNLSEQWMRQANPPIIAVLKGVSNAYSSFTFFGMRWFGCRNHP